MNDSILTSIKKLLGIDENDTSFDADVIMHINSVLMIIAQEWFDQKPIIIEDKAPVWSDFIGENEEWYEAIKSLVYLRVRILFDPPTNSFVLNAMNDQIKELEWRMYVWKDNERIDSNV